MTPPLDLERVEEAWRALHGHRPGHCSDVCCLWLPSLLRIARAAAVARRHQREGHDHDCSYRAPRVDREHPSGYVCLDALDDALEGRER